MPDEGNRTKNSNVTQPSNGNPPGRSRESNLREADTADVLVNPLVDGASASQRTFPPLTKRQALSDISKIYDPLGILAHVTVCLNMCMKEIWKQKTGWDDLLPDYVAGVFFNWRESLPGLREISIPQKSQNLNFMSFAMHLAAPTVLWYTSG
jgi:hypothetical protein